MIVRGPSQAENRPRETVTQRLERLRIEHRRHLRNTGIPASQLPAQALVTTGPSLPDGNIATTPNALDTWDDDRAVTNIRPRPARPINPNPAQNANRPPDRAPVTGPPPPRSWVNPAPRRDANTASRRPSATTQARKQTARKSSKRVAPGTSLTERRRLREDEMMRSMYRDECWFREAEDVKWTAWREEALRLVFSYGVGNSDTGRQLLNESVFTPFRSDEGGSGIRTLFETLLKFIFPSPSHEGPDDRRRNEDEDADLVEIIQSLPVHIRKYALRYAAAHRPLNEEQWRRTYVTPDDDPQAPLSADPNGSEILSEVILSGHTLQATVLDPLHVELKKRDTTEPTGTSSIIPPPLQSNILFQTPYLQKRHLNSFPKTLTTLGLIALPPPKELLEYSKRSQFTSGTSTAAETSTTLGCCCPWCASAEPAKPIVSLKHTSSLASASTIHITQVPCTSSTVVFQLIDLPTLLPSLVILDVSYNPWMTASDILRITNPVPKGSLYKRRGEPAGQGIFGYWDLRLWGRMKVLGVRGCFERVPVDHSTQEDPFGADADGLIEIGDLSFTSTTGHCGCGVPPGSPAEWRKRGELLEKWEKTMYAVGRDIEVIWREHACRCRSRD